MYKKLIFRIFKKYIHNIYYEIMGMNASYDDDYIRSQIKILDYCDEFVLRDYSNIELAARYSKNENNFDILRLFLKSNTIEKEILNKILSQIVTKSKSTSSIDAVKLLIDYGADVNFIDSDKYSILMMACSSNNENTNYDVAKLLIERGANINYVNSYDRSVLSLICNFNFLRETNKVAILLIECGANINIKDINGKTELMNLISSSKSDADLKIMKLLIRKGMQSKSLVNCQDNDFKTPLMICFDSDYNILIRYNIIKLLLDNKADIYIKNKKGENILDIVNKKIERNSDIYSLIFNYKNLENDHLYEFDIDFIYKNF